MSLDICASSSQPVGHSALALLGKARDGIAKAAAPGDELALDRLIFLVVALAAQHDDRL